MSEKKKDKADVRLQQLCKAMGIQDDSVRRADQHIAIKDVISTGHADLDNICTPMIWDKEKRGGIPRGFVCEFFGPYAGGKSALCLKLAAQVTQKGDGVLWVDAESSYIPERAAQFGVDNTKVIYMEGGKHGEYYLERVEEAAKSGHVALIVIDSVTNLQPKDIFEGDLLKDPPMARFARMMSRAMPRIVSAAREGNTSVIFINQIREKVGIMYGNPETTPGGKALLHGASLRLRISQAGKSDRGIMKEGEEIGIRSNVQIVKSRFGPPYKEAVMPIYYSNVKPHPLDMMIDAGLQNKFIKSRSKKLDNGDLITTFSFLDIRAEGVDEFKKELDNKKVKELAKMLEGVKFPFDQESHEYLETLDFGEPKEDKVDADTEGDPGA